jgi:hypothetical protein
MLGEFNGGVRHLEVQDYYRKLTRHSESGLAELLQDSTGAEKPSIWQNWDFS